MTDYKEKFLINIRKTKERITERNYQKVNFEFGKIKEIKKLQSIEFEKEIEEAVSIFDKNCENIKTEYSKTESGFYFNAEADEETGIERSDTHPLYGFTVSIYVIASNTVFIECSAPIFADKNNFSIPDKYTISDKHDMVVFSSFPSDDGIVEEDLNFARETFLKVIYQLTYKVYDTVNFEI